MIASSEARMARLGADSFTASDGVPLGYCTDDFADCAMHSSATSSADL
jgi:hypothetical protein